MLHTIAHYGFIVASGCSGLSAFILLVLLVAVLDTARREWKNLVWEVPAVWIALGVFWGFVAFGLSRL